MIIKLLMHENCSLGYSAVDNAMETDDMYSVFCLIKCGAVLQIKQGNLKILFTSQISFHNTSE